MRNRPWAVVAALVVASTAGGCTTVLYKGPSRPESEIAVLHSQDTQIDRVDRYRLTGKTSGSSARLEVLPGYHEVGVSLSMVIPGFLYHTVRTSKPIVVCVNLKPGHTYRTRASVRGNQWEPEIIDENTQTLINPYCDDPGKVAAGKRTPPVPVPPEFRGPAVAAAAPNVPAAAPADAGAELAQAVAPDAAASPDGGAAAVVGAGAPPAAASAPQASDSEIGAAPRPVTAGVARPSKPAPRVPHGGDVEEPPATEEAEAEDSGRRPGSGLSFTFGFGFGGADFVKASSSSGNSETLSAGTGVIVGLGAMVTPLWPAEGLGFGLGVDGSLKYDSVDADNGSASITRFPLAFTAHMLTNGSGGPHYFLLKGGLIRDFGVNYSASGFASIDADVKGTWGPTGALGYYNKTNDVFAWDVLGFFAITDHVIGTEHISANTFGLTMGMHLNL